MRRFEKRYTVNEVPMWDISRALGTFNATKFGRNRRGTVMLETFEANRDSSGLWRVVLHFATGKARHVKVIHGPKCPVYRLTDLSRLAKVLNSKREEVAA